MKSIRASRGDRPNAVEPPRRSDIRNSTPAHTNTCQLHAVDGRRGTPSLQSLPKSDIRTFYSRQVATVARIYSSSICIEA